MVSTIVMLTGFAGCSGEVVENNSTNETVILDNDFVKVSVLSNSARYIAEQVPYTKDDWAYSKTSVTYGGESATTDFYAKDSSVKVSCKKEGLYSFKSTAYKADKATEIASTNAEEKNVSFSDKDFTLKLKYTNIFTHEVITEVTGTIENEWGEETPENKFELTEAGIKLNGVLLEKTAEQQVMDSAVTVTGSDFFDSCDYDFYQGVFISGRNVTLSPFIMSKYEVTQELYSIVMKDQKVMVGETEYILDANPFNCKEIGTYPLCDGEVQKYRPAEGVNWYDAVYFCNVLSEKIGLKKPYSINITRVSTEGHILRADVTFDEEANGYRLPTEAEWEFAARGGDISKPDWNYWYSGSTRGKVSYDNNAKDAGFNYTVDTGLDKVGWYEGNTSNGGLTGKTNPSEGIAGYGTHEVGKKAANALGLYDMSGNVCEWCYDGWQSNDIEKGNFTDPYVKPGIFIACLYRGGSWHDDATKSYVTFRYHTVSSEFDKVGFRLCRSVK